MGFWHELEPNSGYVCEYRWKGERKHDSWDYCNHSDDPFVDSDGRHNGAQWQYKGSRSGLDAVDAEFLCNYHYEELVLGETHPQDDPVEPEAVGFEPPTMEDFINGVQAGPKARAL